MMMFDMHPDTAKHFYKEACPTGREMTKKTGIAELVPGAVVDDFAFDPCGWVYVQLFVKMLCRESYGIPAGFHATFIADKLSATRVPC